jgi:arylsulfatase A-like enzyme
MNFLILILDTLRYDHLACNGCRPIETPAFDGFSSTATNFARCYTGSYPSQPHRCDCASGRFVFPFYGWQQMPEDETHLVPLLAEAGYRTQIIADSGLPFELGLSRGFGGAEQITSPVSDDIVEQTPWPCDPKKSRTPEAMRRLWALRTHVWKREDDWPQARVMNAARSWLEENGEQPFFLWVESWRIHEPWVDPAEYVDKYDPGYSGEVVALPSYSPDVDYLSPEELRHVQAMYAASVTFTDHCFARLLEHLESAGRLEDTCVVVSSDHGFAVGDHNRTGKHGVPSPKQEPWPLYEECAHVPLLVHLPGQKHAGRSARLVQHADLMPTVLDLAGLEAPDSVRGRSWRALLEGGDEKLREAAVTSSRVGEFPTDTRNTRTTVTTPAWSLIMPTDRRGPELYNLATDPGQTADVFAAHRPIADRIHAHFLQILQELDADPAHVQSWQNIW